MLVGFTAGAMVPNSRDSPLNPFARIATYVRALRTVYWDEGFLTWNVLPTLMAEIRSFDLLHWTALLASRGGMVQFAKCVKMLPALQTARQEFAITDTPAHIRARTKGSPTHQLARRLAF